MKYSTSKTQELLTHPFVVITLIISFLDDFVSVLGIEILGRQFEGNLIYLWVLEQSDGSFVFYYWLIKNFLVLIYAVGSIIIIRSVITEFEGGKKHWEELFDISTFFMMILIISGIFAFMAIQPVMWSMSILTGAENVRIIYDTIRLPLYVIMTIILFILFIRESFWLKKPKEESLLDKYSIDF
jgi:hypothetical protein